MIDLRAAQCYLTLCNKEERNAQSVRKDFGDLTIQLFYQALQKDTLLAQKLLNVYSVGPTISDGYIPPALDDLAQFYPLGSKTAKMDDLKDGLFNTGLDILLIDPKRSGAMMLAPLYNHLVTDLGFYNIFIANVDIKRVGKEDVTSVIYRSNIVKRKDLFGDRDYLVWVLDPFLAKGETLLTLKDDLVKKGYDKKRIFCQFAFSSRVGTYRSREAGLNNLFSGINGLEMNEVWYLVNKFGDQIFGDAGDVGFGVYDKEAGLAGLKQKQLVSV